MRPHTTATFLCSLVLLLAVSSTPGAKAHKVSPPTRSHAQRENFDELAKPNPHHRKVDNHYERKLRSKYVRRRKRVTLARSHYWSATTGEAVLTYANWTQRHDQKFLDTITVLNPAPKIIFPGTGTTKSTHDWSYFDMVYVITLEGHENVRLKSVLFEVSVKANIPMANITVVKSKRDKSGVRGCFNAHKFVADHALSNGYSRVVVFEDDVKLSLSRFTADKLSAVINFLQMKDRDGGWDVFFFATMTLTCQGSEVDYIKRVQSLTTAAYATTRETLQQLVMLPYSGGSVDAQFFSNLARSYSHYPMLMYQRDDISSTIKQRRYSPRYKLAPI